MSETTAIMPSGQAAPSLLTEKEAFEFLRIDDTSNPRLTLRRYREKGVLHFTRIGNQFLYTADELMRFLARQSKGNDGDGEDGK